MVDQPKRLRPLRITRSPGGDGVGHIGLPPVLEPLPERAMAPDWSSPTDGNGAATPRAELHVALVAPDATTAAIWRQSARVIVPPLWKGGKVTLHVIHIDSTEDIDTALRLALVDLGFLDAKDVGLIGYPSGVPS